MVSVKIDMQIAYKQVLIILEQEVDILSRECTKKGVLHLRDNTKHVS